MCVCSCSSVSIRTRQNMFTFVFCFCPVSWSVRYGHLKKMMSHGQVSVFDNLLVIVRGSDSHCNSKPRKVIVGLHLLAVGNYFSSLNLEIRISPLKAVISSPFPLDWYCSIRVETVRVNTHPIRNGASNLFPDDSRCRRESQQHYVEAQQDLVHPFIVNLSNFQAEKPPRRSAMSGDAREA